MPGRLRPLQRRQWAALARDYEKPVSPERSGVARPKGPPLRSSGARLGRSRHARAVASSLAASPENCGHGTSGAGQAMQRRLDGFRKERRGHSGNRRWVPRPGLLQGGGDALLLVLLLGPDRAARGRAGRGHSNVRRDLLETSLCAVGRHPPVVDFPKIEAIILFGEPVRWETNLQLIIDVLLTSGYPGNPYPQGTYPHTPVLACNMDLMWAAEAHSPRFGHGTFMVCLENIYKKITGKELKYEALMGKPSELTYHYAERLIRTQAAAKHWRKPIQTLYAVGDNLMTDIYGANLYNRYLEEKSSRRGPKARIQAKAAGGTNSATVSQEDDLENTWESELASATATNCRSVLVCTGVFSPHTGVPSDTRGIITETAFHGHRDFRFDPALVEPDHIVPDVDAAVDLIFHLENFAPSGN
ncbi:haloacid dehalogenase-like hydrolase domain-containing 5 [Varanus komodoensis]|uniref:haloacid dehalogenase-like hydrolase domain-containing 5 n=1 Tax=Varanus komodoensis TaxID=61221 RepID=UPI001CF78A93|nr:haloacid dehalogenase-like hydrolase domain-containing 5 [Varanus komodoensis]